MFEACCYLSGDIRMSHSGHIPDCDTHEDQLRQSALFPSKHAVETSSIGKGIISVVALSP
jgi:hypothetical protein